MIILSIVAVMLAGALLGLILQTARPASGGSPDGQGGRITPDGGGRTAVRPQRPPLGPPIFDRDWFEDLR